MGRDGGAWSRDRLKFLGYENGGSFVHMLRFWVEDLGGFFFLYLASFCSDFLTFSDLLRCIYCD